jgi:ATP-dependent HslUV protease ATP-binding subunit HslU
MKELTPRKIVEELDRYIIGQEDAKRAVAIAIRNRWRRQQLSDEMREEVLPKNIIMIGPTGVGKTEIARRLAGLVGAPFMKVEVTRYTEVGYYGRDVESMIRDLVGISVNMVRRVEMEKVRSKAEANAEEELLALLYPERPPSPEDTEETLEKRRKNREKFMALLRSGKFDERKVEITTEEKAQPVQVFGAIEVEQMGEDFQNLMEKILPSKKTRRKVTVAEARKILIQQESEKLIDKDKVITQALDIAQNSGIVFLDEIDKVVGSEHSTGPDVSRAGVQRDLLPIVEGTTVSTRYGLVKTDHILFVAAGAFSKVKPSDLIPELQGRFPIRVELGDLGKDEFVRILQEPQNALTKQYRALLETEEVEVAFTEEGIAELAEIAADVNRRTQNIGARRLMTVVEKVLEDISFDAPEVNGKTFEINADYVRKKLADIIKDEDLSKYIL